VRRIYAAGYLQNLVEPSVIIMDKVPYHSVLLEEPTTESWRKDKILTRLQEKGIYLQRNISKLNYWISHPAANA
jgi:hypothetical protein